MAVAPDSHGIIKPGKEDEAEDNLATGKPLAHQHCDFQVQCKPDLRRIH